MAFDFTRAITMVRALAPTFLGGIVDGDIQSTLTNSALPTIRTYFLTATDGANQALLYTLLTDLGDSGNADAAEAVIDALFDEPTLADSMRAIAARLAAVDLLRGNFPTLDTLNKQVIPQMAKAAMAELDRITKSPQLKTAAAATLASRTSTTTINGTTLLTLALDADVASKNITTKVVPAFTGAQLPYSGAPEAGKFGMILNGQTVEVTVAEGDTPAQVLDALLRAYELQPDNTKPNANLLVNEKLALAGNPSLEYTDTLTGNPRTDTFALSADGATLALSARDYEQTANVAAATFYLTSRNPADHNVYIPGIKGLRYGISTRWSDLTAFGPHAMAVNLTQGKITSLSSGSSSSTKTTQPLSDAFFFQISDSGGVTTADGTLVYQVNALTAVTVTVTAGKTALEVAALFAQSLATLAADQRVIGAVRPPLTVAPSGSPLAAPSLELVSFALETSLTNIVVSLKTVPPGLTFAVVAPNASTTSLFDAREKAIVVKTTVNKPKVSGTSTTVDGTTPAGNVITVVYTPSPALAAILGRFKRGR